MARVEADQVAPANRGPLRRGTFCRRRRVPHMASSRLLPLRSTDLVNRYYDPTTEQFISVDPLVSQTGQPISCAGDDPVNTSDPSGLTPLGDEGDGGVNNDGGFEVADFQAGAESESQVLDGEIAKAKEDPSFCPTCGGETQGEIDGTQSCVDAPATDVGHAGIHQFPGIAAGRSQFFDGEDLGQLSDTRDASGVVQKNGNVRYVLHGADDVGVDRTTGLPTNIYTVIRKPDGSVLTMYPGTSPMS